MIEPISEISSSGIPTIRPNSPVSSLPTVSEFADYQAQTPLEGLDISKMAKINIGIFISFTCFLLEQWKASILNI